MDFTIKQYTQLLKALQSQGFFFQTFEEFLTTPLEIEKKEKTIILRHDVDLLPNSSLQFAKIQVEFNIKGSYFFRAVPESWDEEIIKEIASLGHEIGYHYEDIDLANSIVKNQSSKFREKDLYDVAINIFQKNLNKLRKLYPVKTICMHGSPRSKFDNKDIWKKYDYRDFGIIGEPYFDIDFSKVLYLTDTGRMWDGYKVSIRDKIEGHQDRWNKAGLSFHLTNDIIKAAKDGCLPDKIIMTFHPQRWHDSVVPWIKELVMQSAKNQVKRVLLKIRA
jgi:hypothetical protein